MEFITEDLPWAIVGRAYLPAPFEVRVSGQCPAGGVGFAVVSGILPPGLQLSRLGYFSGTPKQIGQFEFTVKAVNGCSWAGRHFALLVTDAPTLTASPAKVVVACVAAEKSASGSGQASGIGQDCPVQSDTAAAKIRPGTIHVAGNWPSFAYQVRVSGGVWLTAAPDRGMTARESVPRRIGEEHGDDIALHFNVTGLKPGIYNAGVTISAWQAESVTVPVELTVMDLP